jgi:hypothetical protein
VDELHLVLYHIVLMGILQTPTVGSYSLPDSSRQNEFPDPPKVFNICAVICTQITSC